MYYYTGHAILMVFTQTAETIVCQKDTQLDQQMRTIQNLNTQLGEKDERLREKDETLRRREEEFRVEVQRKETRLHQKENEIHRKDADISRLQRELQVCS